MDVDVAERDLLLEVQAHHHHPGDPEENDVEAGDQNAGRIVALRAPSSRPASPGSRTATGPRRTRCRARPRRAGRSRPARRIAASARPRPRSDRRARRRRRAPRRRRLPRSPRHSCRPTADTRPESDAPTRAGATRTTAGCSRASRNRSSPSSSARTSVSPSLTAASAGCASVLASTYHWSVSQGSMTTFERSPCGTMCACGSILASRPSSAISSTMRMRASKRSTPSTAAISRACSWSPSRGPRRRRDCPSA